MIFNGIIYFATVVLAWILVIYVYFKEMDVEDEDSK